MDGQSAGCSLFLSGLCLYDIIPIRQEDGMGFGELELERRPPPAFAAHEKREASKVFFSRTNRPNYSCQDEWVPLLSKLKNIVNSH